MICLDPTDLVCVVRSIPWLQKHASRFDQHSSMSMNATKTQSLRPIKPERPVGSDLLALLNEWIGKNRSGSAILLRALPEREVLRSRNQDVDLLVTSEQASELLRLAYEDVQNGCCHVQIESRHRSKIQLILWATDTSERLSIDLWLEWNQTLSRRVISASALQEITESSTKDSDVVLPNVSKLPDETELALLVLHIVTKKRGVISAINRRRLFQLIQRLETGDWNLLDLQNLVTSVRNDLAKSKGWCEPSVVSGQTGWIAEALLRSRLKHGSRSNPPLLSRASNSVKNGLMSAIRFLGRAARRILSQSQCPTLAFIGSDGCGKTSLTALVCAAHSGKWKTVVGRKLYRRSLLYSVLSSVTRSVFKIPRSDFDDRLAAILSFRAMMVCWVMLFWLRIRNVVACSKQGLVLDRSPESMLVTGRRLGEPAAAWGSRFVEFFAPPLRQVLLLVPFEVLSNRKQELSASAHEQYQRLLFEQMIRQPVVSTLLLSNSGSPLSALESLEEIFELSTTPEHITGVEPSQPATLNTPAVSFAFSAVHIQPDLFFSAPNSEHRKDRAA